MKNEFWKTIGISALTSVIVFVMLYFAFGQVLLGPVVVPKEINANACSADGVCEMREARADTGIFGGYLSIQSSLYADGGQVAIEKPITSGVQITGNNNGVGLEISTGLRTGYLSAGGQTGGGLYVDGSQVSFNSPITSDVTVSGLGGNSTGYVCVDSEGKLLRSQTPCV